MSDANARRRDEALALLARLEPEAPARVARQRPRFNRVYLLGRFSLSLQHTTAIF